MTAQKILAKNLMIYRYSHSQVITDKAFAKQLGIAPTTLSKLMACQIHINLKTLQKIADGIGVAPATLLTDLSKEL